MKLKVIERFNDIVLDEICFPDDVIERPKERAEHLIKVGVAEKYEPNKAIADKGDEVSEDEE